MKVAVVGAGSWGTALAQVAAVNGHDVALWARRGEIAQGINGQHRNPNYLTDAALSQNIWASSTLEEVLLGADAIVSVTPSRYARETANDIARALDATRLGGMLQSAGATAVEADGLGDVARKDTQAKSGRAQSCAVVPIVVCTKGVEGATGMVPVQVFADVLGENTPIAALSGPNHAEEIVKGVPAGTVVASGEARTARFFQDLLGSASFRVYTSDDVIGVELCAAFKNIIAIAVGISYGLGYGDNTAAMLMTRGQAEMSRLVQAAGGNALTCMGLAGTGDLIATCMSRHSRNRMFGEALALGESLEEYEARKHMVVEGAQACKTIATLSKRFDVELPITDVVRGIVWEGADVGKSGMQLLTRCPKPEFY